MKKAQYFVTCGEICGGTVSKNNEISAATEISTVGALDTTGALTTSGAVSVAGVLATVGTSAAVGKPGERKIGFSILSSRGLIGDLHPDLVRKALTAKRPGRKTPHPDQTVLIFPE